MANPQRENGHTEIANEIIEALVKANLTGAEFSVCLLVLRKTYGWNKHDDFISLSQFIQGTMLAKRTIIYSLQNLESKKILIINHEYEINLIKFNKDHESWLVHSSAPQVKKHREQAKVTGAQLSTGAQDGKSLVHRMVKSLPNCAHTKETITKETITKENTMSKFDEFWKNYPLKKGKGHALRAWGKIKMTEEIFKKIISAIEEQKEEKELLKRNDQFCPEWKHPSTWLNAECWNDEIIIVNAVELSPERQNQIARENMKNYKSIMPDD